MIFATPSNRYRFGACHIDLEVVAEDSAAKWSSVGSGWGSCDRRKAEGGRRKVGSGKAGGRT
eukprot:scaffold442_cov268-Pinguiococcus_pyrenoidosus.AAC.6